MDATVATGAAAMMAVRVLLDYDVPEENIQLVSLLMAEIGVHSIAYAFPKVSPSEIDVFSPIRPFVPFLTFWLVWFCFGP